MPSPMYFSLPMAFCYKYFSRSFGMNVASFLPYIRGCKFRPRWPYDAEHVVNLKPIN